MEERLVSPQKQPEDEQGLNAPVNLRPNSLADFVGQKQVCENLKVFIEAAKKRGEALDHVLLFGPPGLGKTTLASIVAKELGVGFRATSAPMISKSGDLAAILTNLERNDVLFIDEIHRLNPAIEEVLYSAMEDFQLDLIIGEGPSARSVRIDLQPFTLVGATTRSGMLSTPLRERFGIPLRLDFYSPEELEKIVTRGANLLGMPLSKEGAMEIAKRSRGTPRVAGRLLRRVRDFGAVAEAGEVDNKMADKALRRLDVDNYGLDAFDRRYLQCIVTNYGGGPVGADTLAAALSEERDTIEEVVEPFLLKLGFLQRTPRGRVISDLGCEYLGIAKLRKNMRFAQNDLFDDLGDKDRCLTKYCRLRADFTGRFSLFRCGFITKTPMPAASFIMQIICVLPSGRGRNISGRWAAASRTRWNTMISLALRCGISTSTIRRPRFWTTH